MPEIYIFCPKCSQDESDPVEHQAWWEGGEYMARCANCHDEAPLKDKMKRRPTMMRVTHGHQEKRA